MANLRYKQGDTVRVKSAAQRPDMIGKEYTVAHAGPWKEGDAQPNGAVYPFDCDYILDDGYEGDAFFGAGIQCRESNLE